MMGQYEDFLNKWAADAQRLHIVGIEPFGFDPGFACSIDNCYGSVDIPLPLAKIICDLIKKAHPETQDDAIMIADYKLRATAAAKAIKARCKAANPKAPTGSIGRKEE